MRLPCDVQIQSRMLPSHGMIKKGRPIRASLVIGRQPLTSKNGGSIYLAVCTAKDRDGAKYCLKGNIVQIFGRFVAEGKGTIRIQHPAQDVCISNADPEKLKSFLTMVNRAHRDQEMPNLQLSSLVPAKQAQVERPKTNVVINRVQDYPLTTGFPKTMEILRVYNCRLKRVDSRILQAQHLKTLDLSGNSIAEIPPALGQLEHLSELILSKNRIQCIPADLCESSNLARSLQSLDVSHNCLTRLPAQLVFLTGLVRLNVSHNRVTSLPEEVGSLRKLRFLDLGATEISNVPRSFADLRLETVDFSETTALHSKPMAKVGISGVPGRVRSLLELAGRAAIVNRIPYKEGDIPVTLCFYLSPSRWHRCFHGHPISVETPTYGHFATTFNVMSVASSVISSAVDRGQSLVFMSGHLCSPACHDLYTSTKFT